VDWACQQAESYLKRGIERLFAEVPKGSVVIAHATPKILRDVAWWLAVDVRGRTSELESVLQVVERKPFKGRAGAGFGVGDAAKKIVERLQKNRSTLFTFLDYDDIPWNNNNAEHAIKAFATLRRVIDGTTTENGLRDFLVLLGLCETCKYKKIDFLDFLLSGSRDISAFSTRNGKKQ
jgi:hypothetical protein